MAVKEAIGAVIDSSFQKSGRIGNQKQEGVEEERRAEWKERKEVRSDKCVSWVSGKIIAPSRKNP